MSQKRAVWIDDPDCPHPWDYKSKVGGRETCECYADWMTGASMCRQMGCVEDVRKAEEQWERDLAVYLAGGQIGMEL